MAANPAKRSFQKDSVCCAELTDTHCSGEVREPNYIKGALEHLREWQVGGQKHIHYAIWHKSLWYNRTEQIYLCSCFRPRERHSSECHYTLEMCWCTCCCGKRMRFPNRGLENKQILYLRQTYPNLTLTKTMKLLFKRQLHRTFPRWGKTFQLLRLNFCSILMFNKVACTPQEVAVTLKVKNTL